MKKCTFLNILGFLLVFGGVIFLVAHKCYQETHISKNIKEYSSSPAMKYALCSYFMDNYDFSQMIQTEIGALRTTDENLRKFILCLSYMDFPNLYLLDSTNIRTYMDDVCTADIIELIETYPSDVVEMVKYNRYDLSKLTGSSYFAMRVPYYYDNTLKLLKELKSNLVPKIDNKVKILNYHPDKLMKNVGYNSVFVDYEIEGTYFQLNCTKLKNGYITSYLCSEKVALYQLYH